MSYEKYGNSDPDFPSAQDNITSRFSCDFPGCTEMFEKDGDFQAVWAEAKRAGWRCFKNKQEKWEHRCPCSHIPNSTAEIPF